MLEEIVILDRSGSMAVVAHDAVGGFNTFLETQKRDAPDSLMTLVQFDTEYTICNNGEKVTKVTPLKLGVSYIPRGGTALYDAIGRTLNEVGVRLDKTPVHERPSKVLVAILTDGEENSSVEFRHQQVMDMIKHQQDKYSWEFIYLGANQDAMKVGVHMGIPSANTVNIMTTGAGMRAFGQTMSEAASFAASTGGITGMNIQHRYTSNLKQEEEAEKK